MKFVRFRKDDCCSYGLLEGDLVKKIEGDIFGDFKITECCYDIADVEILIPCQPSKIVCVGLNYRAHAQEVNLALPEEPVIFLKPPSAALPHKGKIVRPAMSGRVDYEGEVGIVIGKMAKNVKPEEA